MCSTCDWRDALEEIRDVLADVELLPERAEGFAASVEEKLDSMAAWIEENEHVTDAQMTAIANMRTGVERWL
mgnify:CR=1 FL=1